MRYVMAVDGEVVYDSAATPEGQNEESIRTGIEQGLAAMQQILDAPQVSFTNISGAQTAMRDVQTAIKAEARQLRRLSRLALGLLDGTE